jgi:hypothetical protein
MSSSGMIGVIPPFNSLDTDWNTYEEILEQFFIVNNVDDEKKPAFLISCVGPETYKTLRDLSNPILPKDRTFAELTEILRKQFSPQVAIFRERMSFYKANQLPGENATSWYGRIKKLSVDCKFGDNLEQILLDKFVTGLRTGQVLDRLCEENESLTLKQAVDIAVNKECSLRESGVSNYQPGHAYDDRDERGSECGGGRRNRRRNRGKKDDEN